MDEMENAVRRNIYMIHFGHAWSDVLFLFLFCFFPSPFIKDAPASLMLKEERYLFPYEQGSDGFIHTWLRCVWNLWDSVLPCLFSFIFFKSHSMDSLKELPRVVTDWLEGIVTGGSKQTDSCLKPTIDNTPAVTGAGTWAVSLVSILTCAVKVNH